MKKQVSWRHPITDSFEKTPEKSPRLKQEAGKAHQESALSIKDRSSPSASKINDRLILEEDRKKGEISSAVYLDFIKYNGGARYVVAMLLAMSCF